MRVRKCKVRLLRAAHAARTRTTWHRRAKKGAASDLDQHIIRHGFQQWKRQRRSGLLRAKCKMGDSNHVRNYCCAYRALNVQASEEGHTRALVPGGDTFVRSQWHWCHFPWIAAKRIVERRSASEACRCQLRILFHRKAAPDARKRRKNERIHPSISLEANEDTDGREGRRERCR
jgi:hypothetical protein